MTAQRPALLLPDGPSLVAGHGRTALLTAEGELLTLAPGALAVALRGAAPPLLVHAPASFRRAGLARGPAFDLLELFAFVLPGQRAAPTPRGLAVALDLDPPAGLEAAAALLPELATTLLRRLAQGRGLPRNRDAAALAARMGAAGWIWAPAVLAALGAAGMAGSAEPLRVWKWLAEWEDAAPAPPPGAHPVAAAEARARLAAMLGAGAEPRPGQADYADAACAAFAPRPAAGDPLLVLAEAGTGTGKTLGYVAPASLWAERNRGSVWVSTYTRHLQRQVEQEIARLHPDPAERRRRVVVRKGRENYLCLLNYEDAVAGAGLDPAAVVPLGLLARWIPASADGDLLGGDLPGWFAELFGPARTRALADRRGECIHGACRHHRRCFVEHTIRRARGAELVVANHALVMAQAAQRSSVGAGLDDATLPTRYVFDEGHHLFDAADGAFAAELSGRETAELRRWLLGAEGGRSRARGLRLRLEGLVTTPALEGRLDTALAAAAALPGPGWGARIAAEAAEAGGNATEALLRLLRRQVLARVPGDPEEPRFAVECDLHPLAPGLAEAAARLAAALALLAAPLRALSSGLAARLDDEAEELDAPTRSRIEGICRSLARRALDPLSAWQAMLRAVGAPPPEPGQQPDHVQFLRLDPPGEVGERDVGLHRHWLDPTIPFAATLAAPAHGLLVTSATLRDGGEPDPELAWASAEARVGAPHLPSPALRAAVASPFNYGRQTRAFVVTDVAGDVAGLAGAYRALFEASGGGALGLFTAIGRLRAVHARIAPALEASGIPLYAQHVDAMDNATLVDVFRAEAESCLLGTDAMRDGVDVPGRALRLVVFERVPWPRPDILHRERRVHLSGGDPRGWDQRIARDRLRQAFGRLIRTGSDRGVFVLLDRGTPSRLLDAFPPGVAVSRVGLAEAVAGVRRFLDGSTPAERPAPAA